MCIRTCHPPIPLRHLFYGYTRCTCLRKSLHGFVVARINRIAVSVVSTHLVARHLATRLTAVTLGAQGLEVVRVMEQLGVAEVADQVIYVGCQRHDSALAAESAIPLFRKLARPQLVRPASTAIELAQRGLAAHSVVLPATLA